MKISRLYDRKYGNYYDDIIAACNTYLSMYEAAISLNIPYKSFIRIAKTLNCYKPNQGGKNVKGKSASKILLDDILNGYYPKYQSNKLRIRLLKENIKDEKCEVCGLDKWNGINIPLELHHIDGNKSNHKLKNLKIICPNCHAQTDTYRFKKRNNAEVMK
jgi:hypothetical protein